MPREITEQRAKPVMQVIDLLTPERVSVNAVARSKKRVLEVISDLLARGQDDMDSRLVFSSLCAREKLGSTGFGHGVAIPHGRISDSQDVSGAFIRLREPVDFDAIDREAVDLIFALIVPEDLAEQHNELLGQLAELLNDPERRRQLRAAESFDELMALLLAWQSERSEG